jgi:hypothetical protein
MMNLIHNTVLVKCKLEQQMMISKTHKIKKIFIMTTTTMMMKNKHKYGKERPTVPHHNGAIREGIPTSLVHLEYTTQMRGVDVADQLQSNYSCHVRTHK